ncbi:FKBP-type peptidyl-prolyl cis-trans isomerase [Mucilaginibacter sp. FT3.2]|uniref:FKBP-type peptidyl-prolyl cis-trans isomerase n=1 Tax=Mucilaginibacter sp. FT3.2 TaxID=2723090 RepID=UPI0016231487|nr:FKBP-type peptidyl-prolyl cis-trans isomerase [Mucilaginibacter sp. FT3.2]MBB6234970.1 FKBP-type peptidyl-prolyl cis-trans isomerase [Mucilaginibacter sp. FT3.2]
MRKITFALVLLISAGLLSCHKTANDPNITQFDETNIQNYIKANGLTGMKRDTTDGDTTGIYYQILSQGATTTPLSYSDTVKYVFTLSSFDGKYNSLDSLTANHYDSFLGHINQNGYPKGLQIAIHNLIKYRGTRARILIPSRLAYGIGGYGTGSASNVNTRIAGNQCLDYYINVYSDQNLYDDQVIKNYMATNSMTGYTKSPGGYYYKVSVPGTGTNPITQYGAFTTTYTGQFFNGTQFDVASATTATSFDFSGNGGSSYVAGVTQGLVGYTAGTAVTLLLPSRYGYGRTGNTGIAVNVCLRFDFTIATITN